LVLILGVDPGSRATGYGIIEVLRNKLVHVDSGTFRLDQVSLQARLLMLHENLSLVIERYKPSEASVEKVFVNRNVDSALKLGHARGVILLSVAKHSLPTSEYTATQIKRSTVGRGHASKEQVQHMVRAILNLERTPSPDASDALAAAICHAHARKSLARLGKAGNEN
jgi:crossover junction endodeoxyribonuclease RuvC